MSFNFECIPKLLCELPVNLVSWERFASKRDLLILSSDVHNRNEVQRGVNIKIFVASNLDNYDLEKFLVIVFEFFSYLVTFLSTLIM